MGNALSKCEVLRWGGLTIDSAKEHYCNRDIFTTQTASKTLYIVYRLKVMEILILRTPLS